MVKYSAAQLDLIFFALSDSTRREIIKNLTRKTRTAQEIARPFDVSLPAISKHLKVLEKAQLVERKIEGRTHFFTLNAKSMEKASKWLEFQQEFWIQSLAKMEKLLTKEES